VLELAAKEFASYVERFQCNNPQHWNCLGWEFDRYGVLYSILRRIDPALLVRPISFEIVNRRKETVHRELVAIEGGGNRPLGWICIQLRAVRSGKGSRIYVDELRYRPASGGWIPIICSERSRCSAERCVE